MTTPTTGRPAHSAATDTEHAGNAEEVVGRAVERVDHPAHPGRAGVGGALLAEQGVVGPALGQQPVTYCSAARSTSETMSVGDDLVST